MSPFPLINQAYEALSPRLRRVVLVLILIVATVFVSTVTILSWNDGSLPAKLGLVATKDDLAEQTKALVAADTVKMQAIADRAAASVKDELVSLMDDKETQARQNVLAPILDEMKRQRADINTLFGAVREQGRDVRAIPGQMSRQLEKILEESKPPLSTEDMLREVMRNQARQDSILNSMSEPKRKRMMKAPTM